uniref:hypothetical protein n=1 Tax=Marinomonas aquimarina TaxID=295068 RepID=UPI000A457DFD
MVARFTKSDADGDDVTVSLSDTTNYALVGDTVVLTEAGAALVNAGEELPEFTLTPNDGKTDGEAVSVNPAVVAENTAPVIDVTERFDFAQVDGASENDLVATFTTADEDG